MKTNKQIKNSKRSETSAKLPDVANYDLHPDYHYSAYWQNREYEHKAEMFAIRSLLTKILKIRKSEHRGNQNIKLRCVLDLGAGFGRLFPSYCGLFKEVILGDYSVKELSDAVKYVKKFNCNAKVNFVALNAYFLPFRKEVFDMVISVRLIHHIEQAPAFLEEIARVLSPGGYLILEVANKNHIKALLRAFMRFKLSYLSKKRIKVSHNPSTSQGLVRGQTKYVFYNYNVDYVVKQAKKVGLELLEARQVSILRSPLLKKILPLKLMVLLDRLYQAISIPFRHIKAYLTPSVFLLFHKPGKKHNYELFNEQFSEILVCPKHRVKLDIDKGRCIKGCSFKKKGKILDLRFPIITV